MRLAFMRLGVPGPPLPESLTWIPRSEETLSIMPQNSPVTPNSANSVSANSDLSKSHAAESHRGSRQQYPPSETDMPFLVETPELLQELSEASESLEQATPQEILRWAVDRYAPRFTMATAFGPEGMVLIHMLAEIAPQTPLFNLDTGYQFAETLELREQVLRRYGMAVELKRPTTTVEEYEQLHGGPLYKTNPNQCCLDRKLVVLRQAVAGMHAWASAIRRDQSPDRARAPIVAWDRKFQLVKISPLANWTKSKVWDLIVKEEIPYNPLHDQGYASIGCQPCTRAVLFGEDERAGRWSGMAKTECGLHTLDGDASSTTSPLDALDSR
jgi:phosphoadenosine phosphosulfate reductase